jgi:streptogramin lyase
MSRDQRPDPFGDGLDEALDGWLGQSPDAVPEGLARAAAARARDRRQRPAWLARFRQRNGGLGGLRGFAPVLAGAAVVIAFLIVGGPLLQRLSGSGAQSTSQPTIVPTVGPSVDASITPSVDASSGLPSLEGLASRTIPLATQPSAVGNAFDSLWVADLEGTLLRLDPATGEEQARIPLDAPGCGPILSDAHALWLASCGAPGSPDATDATTIRVDPATNQVVNRYEDDEPDGVGIATLSGNVWFISGPRELTAAGGETGGVLESIDVERPIRHLTGAFGSLWVTPIGEARVSRVDPTDGSEIASVPLSGESGYLTATGDTVWVAEPHQWLFARIDPTTNAAEGEYMAAPGADQIVSDGLGVIWALCHEELIAFDPATQRDLGRYAVPLHDTVGTVEALALAADDGGIWYGAPDALWFVPSPG